MPIDPLTASTAIVPAAPAGTSPSPAGGASAFGESLRSMLGAIESSTGEANDAVGRMVDGSGDVHTAMIALQQADTMVQMTVAVRNKLVQAYQDVMRMPL